MHSVPEKVRVFLVDDLPLGLRLMERSLQFVDEFELAGTAFSGSDALTKIPEARPQLLVTDLEMPDMDGLELTRKVRSSFPNIQVLVTSDTHQATAERRAKQAGAHEYCGKSSLVAALVKTSESFQFHGSSDAASIRPGSNWAEQLFGGLLFSSAAGLAICDRSFRYQFINPALAAMNGLPAGEHLNKTVREVLGDFADILEPKFQQVFSTGEPLQRIEVAATTLPSRLEPGKWIEDYFPITDSKGEVTHIAIVVVEASREGVADSRKKVSESSGAARYSLNDPVRILSSWKEIAGYASISVRTAQRWEQDFELPVRRLRTQKGAAVMAFKSDMDHWLASAAHLRGPSLRNDSTAIALAISTRPREKSPDIKTEILRTWKEIARYLAASVRAVQRWERELKLPVQRIQMKAGVAVIAFKPDLEEWIRSRRSENAY